MSETDSPCLKIGLPKGSLSEPTFDLFDKAGYQIHGASRSYKPAIDDPEMAVRLIRAQEIGRYVDHGFLDCGITGKDWIAENGAEVEVVCDLQYSKATANPTRWVLVVPNDSPIKSVQDLQGKRIAAEATGLVERYLAEKGVEAEVEFSWGATEVKVPDLVDAIVDITETGSSLRANNLRIVDTLMESFPQLVANRDAWADPWKRKKIERLSVLLKGALLARDMVGLKLNLPENQLQNVLDCLPSLRQPTVSHLTLEGWVAVGAEGIIEYPLNKVVN
jgi:ATP phosphoribosyltransferase